MQEYRGESSEYFNKIRRGMGQGRQHTIHRAIDIYLKDIYKMQHYVDEAGKKPIRECRNHKNDNWWQTVKDIPGHVRAANGQMRTMEGRKTKEHEDMIKDIIGRHWETHIDMYDNIDNWLKDIRPMIAEYLRKHKLPQDPKYENQVDKEKKWKEQK